MEGNNSLNNTFVLLNAQSISLITDLVPAFILWMLIGTLNALSACLTIIIIIAWKPLQTDTQILVAHLSLTEIMGGLLLASIGCYHLINAAFGTSETTTRRNCYMKVGIQYFTIDVASLFHFVISIDRFFAAIFPILYSKRPRRYSSYLAIVAWGLPTIVFALSYVDLSDVYIPVCLVRAATGDVFFPIYIYSLLIVSIASVLVYCITMVTLRYQLKVAAASQNPNVVEIKRRMHSQVTKALAFSAILHFITFTTGAFGAAVIANLSFRGTSLGPYFGAMYVTGGTYCFGIYLSCQKQFRVGFGFVMLKIKTKFKSMTSSVQTGNGQDNQTPVEPIEMRNVV